MILPVRRTVLAVLALSVGAALLVWQVHQLGLERITSGLSQVGWGFLLILLLSLLRFVARSIAWTTLIGQPVPIGRAVAATISGDALGNVTPLSLLVSEPVKAMYLDAGPGSSRSLAALAAENFFYSVSVGIYVTLGTAAMLREFPLPPEIHVAGVTALGLMALVLAVAAWTAWQKPTLASAVVSRLPFGRLAAVVDRVRDFEVRTYGSAGRQGWTPRRRLRVRDRVPSPQFSGDVADRVARDRRFRAARRLRPRHVQPDREHRREDDPAAPRRRSGDIRARRGRHWTRPGDWHDGVADSNGADDRLGCCGIAAVDEEKPGAGRRPKAEGRRLKLALQPCLFLGLWPLAYGPSTSPVFHPWPAPS